ncbi:unnamed protein product [Calypogeia fissa]
MGLTYERKLSRSEMGAETLPCEGRKMKYGGIDKFHMQRNLWSSNLYSAKPSEFYNPIWTGIPMEEYNPRLTQHFISGDIERKKKKEEPRPYGSFYLADRMMLDPSPSPTPTVSRMLSKVGKEKAAEREEEEEKKKGKKKEKPHYMLHAKCWKKSKHIWPLLNYCLPCERVLQYKIFTKTLQIKRADDEAKYRSKDPWGPKKVRRGTSPVHAYHPMQTCDDDYWPKQSKFQAKEKLEIYDRRKDALEAKKQEEEAYRKEHPPAEKEEKKWVATDLTKLRPRHQKATRSQGSRAVNSVLPLKTTNPTTVVPPFAIGVQERAASIIAAPHSQGIPLEEQEVYSLDHIHPQVDHNYKYYPPGHLAFTPIHHQSKFQGLLSPRWRNMELYKTKRPHCTRYGGIHDVTRNADGTNYLDTL